MHPSLMARDWLIRVPAVERVENGHSGMRVATELDDVILTTRAAAEFVCLEK